MLNKNEAIHLLAQLPESVYILAGFAIGLAISAVILLALLKLGIF